MRAALAAGLVCWVGGCQLVFPYAPPPSSIDAAPQPECGEASDALADLFDSGVLGPLWDASQFDGITVRDGQLALSGGVPTVISTHWYYALANGSHITFDLDATDSNLVIEARLQSTLVAADGATVNDTTVGVEIADRQVVVFRREPQTPLTFPVGAYDRDAHRYLRLENQGGSFVWLASPDGSEGSFVALGRPVGSVDAVQLRIAISTGGDAIVRSLCTSITDRGLAPTTVGDFTAEMTTNLNRNWEVKRVCNQPSCPGVTPGPRLVINLPPGLPQRVTVTSRRQFDLTGGSFTFSGPLSGLKAGNDAWVALEMPNRDTYRIQLTNKTSVRFSKTIGRTQSPETQIGSSADKTPDPWVLTVRDGELFASFGLVTLGSVLVGDPSRVGIEVTAAGADETISFGPPVGAQ